MNILQIYTMRIFLPNVLSYQIPRIQLPDFGNTFLAEFAKNVFGMCLPMDWIMIPLFGKLKKWDLNQFTNSWDKIVNFTKFLVPTYQSLLYDTCNSCVADIFKTNKNLSQEFIFWIKKWQIELFSVHIYLELWRSQWSASTRTWFRGIFHVVNCKKVSWFFNFCHLFQIKSSLFLKTWLWKLCLYLCCTFSKCHRLFSCFGGAWAYFG